MVCIKGRHEVALVCWKGLHSNALFLTSFGGGGWTIIRACTACVVCLCNDGKTRNLTQTRMTQFSEKFRHRPMSVGFPRHFALMQT